MPGDDDDGDDATAIMYANVRDDVNGYSMDESKVHMVGRAFQREDKVSYLHILDQMIPMTVAVQLDYSHPCLGSASSISYACFETLIEIFQCLSISVNKKKFNKKKHVKNSLPNFNLCLR